MLDLVIFLSALACGLMAGFFFAFSICVMGALGKIPAAHGIAAMQSINVVVINPWFLTAFFGNAVCCLLAIIGAMVQWNGLSSIYTLAAGVLYLVGTILVTMLFNVPRNNALAVLVPDSPEAASLWSDYLRSWTAWNHVRTVAPLLAATLFMIALRVRA